MQDIPYSMLIHSMLTISITLIDFHANKLKLLYSWGGARVTKPFTVW